MSSTKTKLESNTVAFVNNKFVIYSLILGFLGFLVSTYLTILHYKNIIPPCNATSGCETVLTSQYASFGPIPVALLGSLFYATIMVLCILIITNYKKVFLDLLYVSAGVGFLVSLILIYIQAYLLHAYCQYCLLSEAISTGIALLAYFKYREDKKG